MVQNVWGQEKADDGVGKHRNPACRYCPKDEGYSHFIPFNPAIVRTSPFVVNCKGARTDTTHPGVRDGEVRSLRAGPPSSRSAC
jgi:hypothetical protein